MREAHVDDLELGVGDDQAANARIATGLDDGERLGRRQVPGVDDELLLGADLQHIAYRGENLAVGAEHLDGLRRILKVLDVVVGIEGGEPHDAAKAALHPPHPVNGIGVDAAHRGVENDAAEHLEAGDVLAREPGAVRGGHHMVLEDERLEPALLVEDRHLLVVHGPAEDVGRGVDVRVHEAGDRADFRRRRREDAHLREHLARVNHCRETGCAGDRDPSLEELAARRMMTLCAGVVRAAEVERARHAGPTAAIGELPSRDIGPPHRTASSVVRGSANVGQHRHRNLCVSRHSPFLS